MSELTKNQVSKLSSYIRQSYKKRIWCYKHNSSKCHKHPFFLIAKFHIWLPEELTPMGDAPTLTSTLKLKRNVVIGMYQDVIEKGYADQSAKFAKKK